MYSHRNNLELRNYVREITDSNRLVKKHFQKRSQKSKVMCSSLHQALMIFDIAKMNEVVEKHGSRSNLAKNHKRYIDYLSDTQGYLQQALVPVNVFKLLDELAIDFPNFIEVIDYYREQIALAVFCAKGVFNVQPLLIAGKAGVGKTAFCHRLAKIMDTYFSLISFSSMSAGFILGGMSASWADGKPGKVVESLASGHYANPIIVLDEIDKAGGDNRYDPLGCLYQLLEKETAAKFVDEGLETATDCSHINWVATANYLHKIPEPIVSRFAIIEVQPPDNEQMHNVLRSIYANVKKDHEWGSRFKAQLSNEISEKIIASQVSPRLIQRELIRACGRAVLRQSSFERESVAIEAKDFVIKNSFSEKKRPIGFVY